MRALLLLTLVACSKQEIASDSGPVDAGPESFASQYAHAVCDSIEGCCAKNHFKLDPSTCLAVVEGEEQLRVNAAAAAGRLVESAIARCLTETRATFQACPTSDWKTAQDRLLRACDVWSPPGSKPIGAPCTRSNECATNSGCDFVDCDNTCLCHHEAGPGSCASNTSDVLDCPRTLDEVFGFFYVFAHDLFYGYGTSAAWYCDIFNDAGRTCTPTDPLGASCDPGSAIGGYVPSCGGATCDKTTKTCARAPIGAPCGRDVFTYCVTGAFCDYPSKTCQPLAGPGEPCRGESVAASCPSHFCDTDVPAAKGDYGQCLASPFAPFYVCGHSQ